MNFKYDLKLIFVYCTWSTLNWYKLDYSMSDNGVLFHVYLLTTISDHCWIFKKSLYFMVISFKNANFSELLKSVQLNFSVMWYAPNEMKTYHFYHEIPYISTCWQNKFEFHSPVQIYFHWIDKLAWFWNQRMSEWIKLKLNHLSRWIALMDLFIS